MLRVMHERVAVISVDASTKSVRQRSASMLEQSVTIARMIEREIATKSAFVGGIAGTLEALRQCAPPPDAHVSR